MFNVNLALQICTELAKECVPFVFTFAIANIMISTLTRVFKGGEFKIGI